MKISLNPPFLMRKIENYTYFSNISCALVSKIASKNLKLLYT